MVDNQRPAANHSNYGKKRFRFGGTLSCYYGGGGIFFYTSSRVHRLFARHLMCYLHIITYFHSPSTHFSYTSLHATTLRRGHRGGSSRREQGRGGGGGAIPMLTYLVRKPYASVSSGEPLLNVTDADVFANAFKSNALRSCTAVTSRWFW